jgi:hypothetical protein
VDSVVRTEDRGANVYLSNRGTMVMPAEIQLRYADGQTQIVKLPVDMWNLGSHFTYRAAGGRPIIGVDVDPQEALPDVDRSNNSWMEARM